MDAIPHPGPVPTVPEKNVTPDPNALKLKGHARRTNFRAGIAAAVVGVAGLMMAQIWVLGIALGVFLGLRGLLNRDSEAAEYRRVAAEAAIQWKNAQTTWMQRAGPDAFDRQKTVLAGLRREWDILPSKRVARISELERNRRQAQLHRFLDNFEISSAKIESIGPGKKQVLESYGIETALDVERNKLYSVPGFGPKTAQKLLNWRKSVEARFVFNPSRAIDPRDIAQIDQDILGDRKRLQGALVLGLEQLKQTRAQILAAREHSRPEMERLRLALDQSSANVAAISG